jgi:hypothetical protein
MGGMDTMGCMYYVGMHRNEIQKEFRWGRPPKRSSLKEKTGYRRKILRRILETNIVKMRS